MKYLLLSLCIIVVLSNFIPYIGIRTFHFQTANNEFDGVVIPAKGAPLESMENRFNNFKKRNPQHKDLQLYRTFEKPLWKFWDWGEYIFDPIWWYPYMEKHNDER
ncbi:MAG: hypothetical protein AAF990_04350 [Bacteroidota bacterium]